VSHLEVTLAIYESQDCLDGICAHYEIESGLTTDEWGIMYTDGSIFLTLDYTYSSFNNAFKAMKYHYQYGKWLTDSEVNSLE
jgi:hypothetical protein